MVPCETGRTIAQIERFHLKKKLYMCFIFKCFCRPTFFLIKPTYLYCTGTLQLFMCGGASVDSCYRSILLNWRSSDNTVSLLCLLSGRKVFPLYELLFQVLFHVWSEGWTTAYANLFILSALNTVPTHCVATIMINRSQLQTLHRHENRSRRTSVVTYWDLCCSEGEKRRRQRVVERGQGRVRRWGREWERQIQGRQEDTPSVLETSQAKTSKF